jgi:rod shape-determining protein MreB
LQIQQLLRRKYGLQVSLHTAEQIKMAIGRVSFGEEEILEFRGSDLIEGLPKEVEISSSDIAQILQQASEGIIEAIKKVLSETPPEILADILDQGMILTGGGALLRGLPELITQEVKVNANLAKKPTLCVAKGTGVILKDLKEYRDILMRLK